MKNKITKLGFVLLLISGITYAQEKSLSEEGMPDYVRKATNVEFLQQFSKEKAIEFEEKFNKAVQIAKATQRPISGTYEDGSVFQLAGLDDEGRLIYYTTYNNTPTKSSLQTANAKPLQALGLTGASVKVAVWDGGVPPVKHYSLTGRITIKDNGNVGMEPDGITHATHVTGTVAASDYIPNAKGFATGAKVWSYNWTGDVNEMTIAASQGLLVSNHSYGLNTRDYFANGGSVSIFGQYNSSAVAFDRIAFNAPYYSIVVAAGNDRQKGYNPSKQGRDLISTTGVSKNVITVASTKGTDDYAGIVGSTSVNNFLSVFSNWGPTDDFRIKPDISAKGDEVLSLSDKNNGATVVESGTSMAAPAVTGVIVLWQEYFSQLFSQYMKAATVKAIMAHSAREAGEAEGPDYKFGWGLINADGGAQIMREKTQDLAVIAELEMKQGEELVYDFEYDGKQSLIATIAWTDPEGSALNGSNNVASLINDLDLRVINVDTGEEFFPWALNHSWTSFGANMVARKDNNRDNLERVNVNSILAGNYQVKVSHKGKLRNGKQDFTLVISGAGTTMEPIGSLSVFKQEFSDLKVYPNPVSDYLNIEGKEDELVNSNVEIYDLAGKRVYSRQGLFGDSGNEIIDVANLKTGVYLLDISNNNKRTILKFLKK